jgi:hypothetical protein
MTKALDFVSVLARAEKSWCEKKVGGKCVRGQEYVIHQLNFERLNFERLNFERPNFERLNFERQLRKTEL